MPVIATIIHVITQIFIVGSGLSIGRETAPRELGSMFGQKLGSWLRLDERDLSIITAVAAGAGFAGVYDAPLAGMFFAVEILLTDTSIRVVMLSFGTSAVAAFTAGLIKGHNPFYSLDHVDITVQLILLCCLIGPIMGFCGYFFRRGTSWATKQQTQNVHILWQLPLAGAITALIAYFSQQIMGNGRALAQFSYNSVTSSSIILLLALAVAKSAVTILTVRTGASGGVLTPAIATGAALGAAIAIPFSLFLPHINIGVVALIASAAFLATSQRAPLMASCLMVELSHCSINAMIAIGIAVALSVVVSTRFEKLFEEHKVALNAQTSISVK